MDQTCCPVCLENGCEMTKLECDHKLCEECYGVWHIKMRKTSCILCRQPIELSSSDPSTDAESPTQNPETPENPESLENPTGSSKNTKLIIVGAHLFLGFSALLSVFTRNYIYLVPIGYMYVVLLTISSFSVLASR